MEYEIRTTIPSLGSQSAGCSVFRSTKEATLDEFRKELDRLQPGESVTICRVPPMDFEDEGT